MDHFTRGFRGPHGGPLRYDPADSKSYKGAAEHLEETNQAITDWRLGIGEFESGQFTARELHNYAGPLTMNYHIWIGKIKTIFDPNLVCEGSQFPSPVLIEKIVDI